MQSGKIFVNSLDGRSSHGKGLGGPSGQRRVKRLEGELPALGRRFGKELLGHGAASVRNAPGARLAAIRRLVLVAVGHLETEGGVPTVTVRLNWYAAPWKLSRRHRLHVYSHPRA